MKKPIDIDALKAAADTAYAAHDNAMAAWADARRDHWQDHDMLASLKGKALAAARKMKATCRAYQAALTEKG